MLLLCAAVFQLLNDGISLTGIASGAKNTQCYLQWTVTPQVPLNMDLARLALGLWSEGSSLLNAELHWSKDNFVTSKALIFGGSPSMTVRDTAAANYCGIPFVTNLSHVAALQNCTGPVTFRLYLWYTGTPGAAGIGKLGGVQQ